MPNPGAEAPLRKVTLNLFEDDCAFLEQSNEAWTVLVRQLVHAEVQQRKHTYQHLKRTLGDLE